MESASSDIILRVERIIEQLAQSLRMSHGCSLQGSCLWNILTGKDHEIEIQYLLMS